MTAPQGYYGGEGRTLRDVYEDKGRPDNWRVVELTTPKERVDAATGSVMEQAAIVQAIYDADFLRDDSHLEIAAKVRQVLNTDLDEWVKQLITEAFGSYEHGKNKLYITTL